MGHRQSFSVVYAAGKGALDSWEVDEVGWGSGTGKGINHPADKNSMVSMLVYKSRLISMLTVADISATGHINVLNQVKICIFQILL